MSISGFIIGLVAAIGFYATNILAQLRISYILHIIDWFNWFTLPLALFGFGLSLAGAVKGPNRILGAVGSVLCAGVVTLSAIHLM
jgi:hypothetical protein